MILVFSIIKWGVLGSGGYVNFLSLFPLFEFFVIELMYTKFYSIIIVKMLKAEIKVIYSTLPT